uniref:Uncharacterized protein n=1 Tax=Echinococcus canadensis TaxID=519352 RepID=A0A915EZU7_9CEST
EDGKDLERLGVNLNVNNFMDVECRLQTAKKCTNDNTKILEHRFGHIFTCSLLPRSTIKDCMINSTTKVITLPELRKGGHFE